MKYNGMATMNGVIFESEDVFVKTSRARNGEINIRGRQIPDVFGIWPKLSGIPFLRIVIFMIDAFFIRPIMLFDISYFFMIAFMISFSYAVENLINFILLRLNYVDSTILISSEILATGLIFFGVIMFLRLTGIASYHAAEHKTGNYLDTCKKKHLVREDIDFGIEDVKTYSRIHPRCGTNLFVPILVISMIAGLFFDTLLSFLIILIISIELISIASRNQNKKWAQIILKPGLYLQRLTTKECSMDYLKIGIISLDMLLYMEQSGLKKIDISLEKGEEYVSPRRKECTTVQELD